MDSIKILALVGSLRHDSYNLKLAKAAQGLAPDGVEVEVYVPSTLPVFNQDLEANVPESVSQLKEKIRTSHGVIVVTPEHNFSFSAATKNWLDWQSRPANQAPLTGKPTAMMSASPGWAGGLRAQIQLKPILDYFEADVMFFPQVCVGLCHQKFDASGKLTDPLATENITKQLNKLAEIVRGVH